MGKKLAQKFTKKNMKKLLVDMYKSRYLYLMLLIPIVQVFVFSYLPVGGIKIAFQKYNIYRPEASEWVGLDNFVKILKKDDLWKAIGNTLYMNCYSLFINFPIKIIFALMLNEIIWPKFKKVTQTITYLPHFLSWIAVIGIATQFLSKNGPINDLVALFGGERQLWLSKQALFVPITLTVAMWKELGWSSVLYLAAISGVDPGLHEAATLDGANRLQRAWHVTLPSIKGTIAIQLIYQISGMFGSNFSLVYGMQNPFIDFEVINTYIYKHGIVNGNYADSTAFGLFENLISLILLLTANKVIKKMTDTGLF